MNETTFFLKTSDEKKLFIRKWIPPSNKKQVAVVQVIHGMAEHSGRYQNFAAAMNEQGIIVYANDQRGHGLTEDMALNRGHFADDRGWDLVIQDQSLITAHIKSEYPNLPVILLGHSLGSFLARSYIQQYGNDITGVIISGTGRNPGIQGKLAKLIINAVISIRGKRYRSPMVNGLIFSKYNQNFKPNRTPYDWISRDQNEVNKYVEDELCGYICTIGFLRDMVEGIFKLHRKENIRKIPHNLPIYIFSGDKDPLGVSGKAVIEAAEQYKEIGIKNVMYKLYEDGRHEMLNEINRDEVYQDIIKWIKNIS
jgi:alpha-beta hydrolase superfamily lysophospholipase